MLNEKLDKYLSEDFYPFHMPGHKRNTDILRSDIPYERDITEIPGFDNLNNPKDLFVELEQKIAEIYGVEDAIITVNGSTNGNLTAIRSLTHHNKNIMIQRSCHKSVYNAIELCNLSPSYIDVVMDDTRSIIGIDYDDFTKMITTVDYAAVLVTSPSFEGYQLDLEKIYSICRENDTPLILDMAHGSHELLSNRYNSKVFDIAITSFHKNLSGLTSSSAILINNTNYSKELRRNCAIFQTTSPSYIILQSIDDMVTNFPKFYEMRKQVDEWLDKLYEIDLKHLKLVDNERKNRDKILISTLNCNVSGQKLADMLHDEKIEIEMAYPGYVMLMATIFDRKEGFERLEKALEKIDSELSHDEKTLEFEYYIPKKVMDISKAAIASQHLVYLNDSKDEISGQFVYAYPPGIPILTPGELIEAEIIENMHRLVDKGTSLNITDTISVLD